MADLPQAQMLAAAVDRYGGEMSKAVVNDAEALLQAIKAGVGKGFLPVDIGMEESGLVALDEMPHGAFEREVWSLVHPDLRSLKRVSVTIDWLNTVFENLSGWRK